LRDTAQLVPDAAGTFTEAELDGLPDLVRRHLAAAITPGTPLARSARLRMRGRIRIGRWLPFRAREVLSPHDGFVWAARAAGVVTATSTGPAGPTGPSAVCFPSSTPQDPT
jgi:hypothetical protein